ncbi:MAG: DNA-binding protein WhiA [Oscillospiraceae bacterium]
MSFSFETKSELCNIENRRDCCEGAEGYALLLFSKCFALEDKTVQLENGMAARRIAEFAASCVGIIPQLTVNLRRKGYALTIPGLEQRQRVFNAYGHDFDEPELRIHGENIENPCCLQAFVRGAFVACGSVSDPQKLYQMEFIVWQKSLAESFAELLRSIPELRLFPGISQRAGSFVVYMKDSGQIEDLLTYVGASNASMRFMQVKMYKEAIGNINRQSNFETANIDKTYSASAKQTAAIAVINDTVGLATLPEDLRAVAELRLHYPEMTLKLMSENLHISRSGVNHRIQKLLEIAGGILENETYKSVAEGINEPK